MDMLLLGVFYTLAALAVAAIIYGSFANFDMMLWVLFVAPFIPLWIAADQIKRLFFKLVVFAMVLIFGSYCHAGGHQRLVRQSGITPRQVGNYEGVGMSTRSYIDARNNACYWGRKTPVSIQYSYRNGRYYAVVRYR